MNKIDGLKAKKLVDKGGKVFDIRSPVDFAHKSIPGSINLTLRNVSHLPKYVKKTEAVILVGDASTKQELEMMVKYAEQMGFISVYTMDNVDKFGK